MTSSQQLAVGMSMPLPVLRGTWMKGNNDRGHKLKVSQNIKVPKARYFSVCYRAPGARKDWLKEVENGSCCGAHVYAIGPNRDELEIKTINFNHTCKVDDGTRIRNYRTRDILDVSNVLATYEPTKSKEGNAKQFATMTKNATGFDMKNGQASLAIRSKSHDTLEAQIGQYLMIPSMFEAYEDADPAGSYILEDRPCPWDLTKKQFFRCYVSISFAKHFWKNASIKLHVCDGTFTRLKAFKHIILICITFDGNNQVIILAFAIVEVENANNWVWFKECLESDFPGCEVWMSDADKGIDSNAFTYSMSQTEDTFEKSRCARHISENCKERNTGKMSEEQKLLIIRLAKARTEDVYQKRLELIRKEKAAWADWLDARKDEFATVSFLQKGVSRYGKVTSNGVENTNSALATERGLPIMHMIESIIKYQKEKYTVRKALGAQWTNELKALTLYAEGEDESIGDVASKRSVGATQANHPVYTASVSVGGNSGWSTETIQVSVNVETFEQDCPCKNYDENGAPCHHVKALLLQLGQYGVSHLWYHERFHVSTYSDSYSGSIPDLTLVGKLKADSTFLPPEYKKPAGRPQKKRKARSWLLKTGVRRICKGCGKTGHFQDGCDEPSTQYRVEQNMGKALEYCSVIENKDVES